MTVKVPAELLERYDRPGPRYTSYPTAPSWSDDFGAKDHADSLTRSNQQAGEPLAMYVHLPFCESMCWYCGCNVRVTQDHGKSSDYIEQVLREARLARDLITVDRPVSQHHWGGGTPTFLRPDEIQRLYRGLSELFPTTEGAEISIEVDPRVTTREHLEVLRELGFNRISMGVQDFNETVQESIHRVQSYEMTKALVDSSRELGFDSVNLDVVYGLPHQNPETFADSIDKVLTLGPDRLACYGYAHVPWLKKHQQVIDEKALPRGRDKLELYLVALEKFQNDGFDVIGMDHFAKSTDAMAKAANDGSLHRNFMGYAVMPAEDMLSFGMTSISEMAGAFAQNEKTLTAWGGMVDKGELPVERGLRRSDEDNRRRAIILDVMCAFRVDFAKHGGKAAFEQKYHTALETLRPMEKDGLLRFDDDGFSVTELGRLFVRNLAMPFDAYLEQQRAEGGPKFSRTV